MSTLLLSSLLGCGPHSPQPLPAPGGSALPDGVYDVSEATLDDPGAWAQLADSARGARYVALGERIHRSVGLSRAKAVGAAWAIESLGAGALAFEHPWSELEATDEALQSCAHGVVPVPQPEGTLFDAGTHELLAWLCARAAAGHPPPRILGTDTQQPWHDVRILRAHLPAESLQDLERCHGAAHESLAAYRSWAEENQFPLPTADDHRACSQALARIERHLDARPPEPRARQRTAHALLGLRTYEEQNQAWLIDQDSARAQEIRDSAQATILAERGDQLSPEAPILVWAHNTHIARHSERIHGTPGDHARTQRQGWRSMGTRLARRSQWWSVAVTGYAVRTGYGARHDPAPPTHPRALEAQLHELGHDRLLVELERWPGGGEWLLGGAWQVPSSQHDALLFVEDAEAAEGHRWSPPPGHDAETR